MSYLDPGKYPDLDDTYVRTYARKTWFAIPLGNV